MNLPITVSVQGILDYCRNTNNTRMLSCTFPDIPGYLIRALMNDEAELIERPEGVYVIPLNKEIPA
jgi:hypothetical protein